MQSNSGSIVHSLYVQNQNFRPQEHLPVNYVYLCSCKECAAVSFYSISFSTLESCNYWTSETVDSIIENGRTFYQKCYSGKCVFISDLPQILDIGTAHVKDVHGARCQGYLSCNVVPSKQQLKTAILDDKESSTSFLMWISSYCISCVFQPSFTKLNKN